LVVPVLQEPVVVVAHFVFVVAEVAAVVSERVISQAQLLQRAALADSHG
jgi:hypothetical protein